MEYYFAFRVSNSSLKEVDFEADFSGSQHVVAIRDSATIDQILDEGNYNNGGNAFAGGVHTSTKKPISRLDQAKPMTSLPTAGGAFGLTDGADALAAFDSHSNNLIFSRPIEMR